MIKFYKGLYIYIYIHIPVRTQLSVIKGMEVSLLKCWILPKFLIFLPVKRQRGLISPGWTMALFSSSSLCAGGIRGVQMILLHLIMSILFVAKGGTCISWGIIIQATGFFLDKNVSRSWSTLLEWSCINMAINYTWVDLYTFAHMFITFFSD